jgi:hypothetical protein
MVLGRHLVGVAHNHATLIGARMRSSEERVHLLRARLILLGCWNVPHQHGVLLRARHCRRRESVAQMKHLLVRLEQAVVGHNGHPEYPDEKCPYSRTLILCSSQQVPRVRKDRLNQWHVSLKTYFFYEILTWMLPMPKLSKSVYV